jgi:hypothetical protein
MIIYLGAGLPVIGAGFLANAAGLLTTVQYFAVAAAALCLAVLLILTRARRSAVEEGQVGLGDQAGGVDDVDRGDLPVGDGERQQG